MTVQDVPQWLIQQLADVPDNAVVTFARLLLEVTGGDARQLSQRTEAMPILTQFFQAQLAGRAMAEKMAAMVLGQYEEEEVGHIIFPLPGGNA